MSRRLSIQYKNSKSKSPKPKVKFADDLVFLDSIKVNDVESVRLMLRRTSADIDINKINDYGLTALHQCVLENSIELVKLLIESNADVNIQDEDSWTPLHAACSMGYYEVAKVLLDNKANVNALTSDNERPIDLVDTGNLELISLLLTYLNRTNSLDEYMTKNVVTIFETHTAVSAPATPTAVSATNIIVIDADKELIIINDIRKFLNNDSNLMTSVTFLKALASAVFQFNFLNCNNTQFKSIVHVRVLKKFAQAVASSATREMEMECLKSLLEFVNRFQISPETFNKIAKLLYEEKIVSKDTVTAFKSNQVKEKEVKGIKNTLFNLSFV